ncbi:uncharacterized protein LOC135087290 isoform X3 [Ostrinia nubilalis]|uniref:uncharacterized protein LOC135087290 isoform X3 n=1 Tax=Ostrinia nubilalis TaxID=29057 RepID=UPI00308223C1
MSKLIGRQRFVLPFTPQEPYSRIFDIKKHGGYRMKLHTKKTVFMRYISQFKKYHGPRIRLQNEEKIPLSSSERPGTSTCSYELQPGTSFQSISYVEDQKEQLDPQTSSVMEIENEKSVDNCTEDEEEGYNTENEKKQFKQIGSSKSMAKENTKLKNTEAAICSYIVENNLPISSIEPLIELIKSLPEKAITSQISLAKQKATNVIRNGLRPFFNNKLINELNNHLFSVYIDETTDVSVTKQLAILVSYCHNFITKVDVIDVVDCPDGTAVGLYTQMINTLKENNVPLQNWIGFCSDTTAVMMGQHNSVSQLIKLNYPQVFVSKCSCHMIHLVASKACTKLSNSLEDLCRNVYNHFGRSPKNSAAFKEFQSFHEVKPHKILRACQTRWLSLQACVRRILEQWEPLKSYWRILNYEDPTHANCHTLQTLENPLIKSQMHFVDYALGIFNDFNCMFQADYPKFSELKTQTEELIKTLALNFMNRNYVKQIPANQINPHQTEEHLELKHIYLGVDAICLLTEIEKKEESEIQKIFQSAKLFYIEAIVQIKKRFVFEDVHNDSSFLNPKNAIDLHPTSLYKIAKKYIPSHIAVDLTELDKEWRNQSLLSDMDCNDSIDTVSYWKKIFEKKNVDSRCKFVQLPILVNYFMSLPFSNAAVERLFSDLKNIKTDKRNRLDNETVASILCVKSGLKRTGTTSVQLMKNQLEIPHLKFVQSNASASESKKIRLSMNKI